MNSTNYITFYEDQLTVIRNETGAFVAIRPICEALGIDDFAQRRKVQNDARFNWHHMLSVAGDGKQREMLCIPISQLNGWLFTINANKVKPEAREHLLRYQQECTDVLYRYFMPNGGTDEELERTVRAAVGEAMTVAMEPINREIRGIRGEIDELKELVHIMLTDTEEREVRDLIKEVKKARNLDGRTIVGHVRRTLGSSGVYNASDLRQVINTLRNMLGKGIFGSVKPEQESEDQ